MLLYDIGSRSFVFVRRCYVGIFRQGFDVYFESNNMMLIQSRRCVEYEVCMHDLILQKHSLRTYTSHHSMKQ